MFYKQHVCEIFALLSRSNSEHIHWNIFPVDVVFIKKEFYIDLVFHRNLRINQAPLVIIQAEQSGLLMFRLQSVLLAHKCVMQKPTNIACKRRVFTVNTADK